MLSLEFWQRLLATEAPDDRLGKLLEGVRAGSVSEGDVGTWECFLTKTELERAKTAGRLGVQSGLDVAELGRPFFIRGNAHVLEKPLVSIVGTRRVSSYGKAMAGHYATFFSKAGCAVVSGGAIGVDSIAHESALGSTSGATVCVLPCGVDVDYPPRHAPLFERIVKSGCLMSPFACGSACTDHRLMARNRYVAAISHATVVIEAPANSGSLTTARHALSLGKPVFAVPGPVTQETFKGSHDLIRQGATLTDDPRQVMDALGLASVAVKQDQKPHLSGDELSVHQALGGLSKSAELIGQETGLGMSAVLAALTMLEIEGIVERGDNGYALKP